MPILQAPALPVVAPAAVGQGPVAADSLHLRLPTLLRTTLAAVVAAAAPWGSELACLQRAGPGRGRRTVPFAPPPGGDPPPPALPMAGTRGLRGPGPAGAPPPRSSPAGTRLLQPELLIYLFPMCALCSYRAGEYGKVKETYLEILIQVIMVLPGNSSTLLSCRQ